MDDSAKTKAQLISELQELRKAFAATQSAQAVQYEMTQDYQYR